MAYRDEPRFTRPPSPEWEAEQAQLAQHVRKGRVARAMRALGMMFVIGAIWWLVAKNMGWDSATLPNAIVFAAVIYFGFKYTTD